MDLLRSCIRKLMFAQLLFAQFFSGIHTWWSSSLCVMLRKEMHFINVIHTLFDQETGDQYRQRHIQNTVKHFIKVFDKVLNMPKKQLFGRRVLQRRRSFHKIHRKTRVPKRLLHRCFPVNFVKFLRTSFLYNTSSGCL